MSIKIFLPAWFVVLLISACSPTFSSAIVQVTPLPSNSGATSSPADTPLPTESPTLAAITATALSTSTPSQVPDDPPATPTPLSLDLIKGEAAAIAAATDAALQPTPRNRLAFDDAPVPLRFDEFYDGYDLRRGLVLSDKLVSLDGQDVVMEGYMAPPLKPKLDFFVLTRIQLAFCPFCSTASDWPDDIALVYLEEPVEVSGYPIRLTGRLEVGASVDQETGMVSLVRIYASQVELLH